MKKAAVFLVMLLMAGSLGACGEPSHCKECDDEVYKDGYCQYHYALNVLKEAVDDTAKEVYDSLFGD